MREPVFEQMFQRAIALQIEGQAAKAEGLYRVVLEALPDDHQAANNLGFLLLDSQRPEQAIPWLRRAVEIGVAPEPARLGLARGLIATSDFAAAEPLVQAAVAQRGDDELRLLLACAQLGLGRFAEAWPVYDSLRTDPGKAAGRGFGVPEWQGEPLAGKRLLIWREQGFGDQLMMARYLPMLEAAHITYAGRPELERLFAQMPVDYLAVRGQWTAGPFHYWTLPLSLPARLGITPDTIPTAPWLRGTPTRRGGIGVMWRGNALPHPERSLSEAAGAELLALSGAVSLDPADSGARDFQDTADLIAGLDVVITVDTSVAHLAGAMGKPMMLLLPARFADWRWMQGRTDSPWYPSARLYRQQVHGDWGPVVAQVKADLADVLP